MSKSYESYGIRPTFVERLKLKMKTPALKERVRQAVTGLTRQQLQHPPTVRVLVKKLAVMTDEKLSDAEVEQMTKFVVAQKIDPNNMVDLLRMWAMFK